MHNHHHHHQHNHHHHYHLLSANGNGSRFSLQNSHMVLEAALRNLCLEALLDGHLELAANLQARPLVICTACPHGNPVARLSQGDDCPAEFAPAIKVLADHGEDLKVERGSRVCESQSLPRDNNNLCKTTVL
jgi:sugar phosphate isomerase/epimerase